MVILTILELVSKKLPSDFRAELRLEHRTVFEFGCTLGFQADNSFLWTQRYHQIRTFISYHASKSECRCVLSMKLPLVTAKNATSPIVLLNCALRFWRAQNCHGGTTHWCGLTSLFTQFLGIQKMVFRKFFSPNVSRKHSHCPKV